MTPGGGVETSTKAGETYQGVTALLGSLSEVDLVILFILGLIVQGELHTAFFLLGHTASVLTV